MSDKYRELTKKYPKLFSAEGNPSPYGERGVECGEGWHDLLDTLCARIQGYVDQTDDIEQPLVEQVKEKFGTLRFYISGYNDYTRGLITMAESMSACICEVCGEKGVLQSGGWLTVQCHECYHAYKEDKQKRLAAWDSVKAEREEPVAAQVGGDEEVYKDEVELYKIYGGE